MKDYLIIFGVVVLYLGTFGLVNYLSHGGCWAVLLVVMLAHFLYVFVKDYETEGSKKTLMALAGGVVIITMGSMIEGLKGWGFDVRQSGVQYVALFIAWLIYHFTSKSDSPPEPPPEPPKKPNKPNK